MPQRFLQHWRRATYPNHSYKSPNSLKQRVSPVSRNCPPIGWGRHSKKFLRLFLFHPSAGSGMSYLRKRFFVQSLNIAFFSTSNSMPLDRQAMYRGQAVVRFSMHRPARPVNSSHLANNRFGLARVYGPEDRKAPHVWTSAPQSALMSKSVRL